MIRIALLILFLPLFNLNAQKEILFKGKCQSDNYLTSVPYELKNYKIIFPVVINGKTYNFLFDTGAPNMISDKIIDEIPHKKLKNINVNDVNDDKQKMKLVSVKELQIGEAIFKNQTAILTDESSNFVFDCFQIDGIIGSNLLRDCIVKMDNEKKELIFTDQIEKLNFPSDLKADPMYFRDGQGSPFIEIKLQGDNGKIGNEYCLFDSGMGDLYDLSLDNFMVYQKDSLFQNVKNSMGSTSIGLFARANALEEYRVLISEMDLGHKRVKNITTITTVSTHSRIGAEFLDHANITLDYLNKNFYFEWKSETPDLNEKAYEFNATLLDGRMAIGSVWDQELKSQIEYGDFILEFNELILSEINLCDLITQESIFTKYNTAHLKIEKKNGEIIELDLVKKFLK
ncbi:MAG: retropepsin-like aspartic protease [Crocinitomicaceae bacterium]